MNGPHNAENIASVSAKIVNQYDFDKSKCHAYLSDGGKNFLKAFPQMLNSDLLTGEPNTVDFWEVNDVELKESPEKLIDPEINDFLSDEINPLQHDIKMSAQSDEIIGPEINDVELDEYNNYYLGDNKIVKYLELLLGHRIVPLYRCTNHKFNITIRNTVRGCKRLNKIMKLLCSFAIKTHQAIKIA